MKIISSLLLTLLVQLCAQGAVVDAASHLANAVTVPMQLELDRPYIDVTLVGPNGRAVQAHAWVDTGGGPIMLSAGLAKRLGLRAVGKTTGKGDAAYVRTPVPALRIGGEELSLGRSTWATIRVNQPDWLDHTDADVALPARDLDHYVVVFDYPTHTFTLGDPGEYRPSGTPVATYIGDSGMPVVWVNVAGKRYGFLLDTGGQFCMIAEGDLAQWSKANPGWPRVEGTYGAANMLFGAAEGKLFMLRLADVRWGPFRLKNIGAVSRPDAAYEKWMTGMVGKPIIGSIGGNVLRDFRVTVDYPAGKVYLARANDTPRAKPSMVGVMFEPAGGGGYRIVKTLGSAQAAGVADGDRLLQVGGRSVVNAPFAHVVNLLSGPPGARRVLRLRRGTTDITVTAPVQAIF